MNKLSEKELSRRREELQRRNKIIVNEFQNEKKTVYEITERINKWRQPYQFVKVDTVRRILKNAGCEGYNDC